MNRLGQIHHHQRDVRIRHGLVAAFDAERFDQVLTAPDARGVDELHRDAVNGRDFRDQIARGAGDVGDNGAILFEQAIEEAALADVGPAYDGQRDAGVDQPAVVESRNQSGERPFYRIDAAQDFLRRGDADVVLGKIDSGFEQRDQFQQLFFDRLDAAMRAW